jgi:signal peptidase I
MNYFKRRAMRKTVKHMLHEVRHVCHMRGDLMTGAQRQGLVEAERALRAAWEEKSEEKLTDAMEDVSEAIDQACPQRNFARISEHLEIIIVAVAVAMAFRTYFIQPFKIPTGSMQPTLYGIQVTDQDGKGITDRLPLSLVKVVLFGERYVEVKSPISGQFRYVAREDENVVYRIAGVDGIATRKFHGDMILRARVGDYVSKGQVLASGLVRRGDHIFVDKIRYNFTRPRRGDIFVFSTNKIQYDRIRPDSFYIKRLVGLPGETISVRPPHLVVDGQPVTEPTPFSRILKDPGYSGYSLARPESNPRPKLMTEADRLRLAKGEYLPMGDNTNHSLDGRYFGAVGESSIVGPAFMVYWPFSKRWGLTK